ncbi:hypothetical protein F0562_015529 [Nyssa sinensis]|uniref:Uncharacterized protein n=1 Tax=Nyssa sinensis TaxID=561372 RepID=A0A5J4ZLU6_9ASTE|nr:hypothetical protein F0562_015529 [Nyssa sinensis]
MTQTSGYHWDYKPAFVKDLPSLPRIQPIEDLNLEVPWLPPRPWKLIPSEWGLIRYFLNHELVPLELAPPELQGNDANFKISITESARSIEVVVPPATSEPTSSEVLGSNVNTSKVDLGGRDGSVSASNDDFLKQNALSKSSRPPTSLVAQYP